MERITAGQLYPNAVAQAQTRRRNPVSDISIAHGKPSFQDLFQDQLVRFSHHAEVRLQQRGIRLDAEQLAKLSSAIDKAASKGAKDSLMLLGGTALIVNIRSKTVVTAMDETAMKDNVFTQIDSAMIIT